MQSLSQVSILSLVYTIPFAPYFPCPLWECVDDWWYSTGLPSRKCTSHSKQSKPLRIDRIVSFNASFKVSQERFNLACTYIQRFLKGRIKAFSQPKPCADPISQPKFCQFLTYFWFKFQPNSVYFFVIPIANDANLVLVVKK